MRASQRVMVLEKLLDRCGSRRGELMKRCRQLENDCRYLAELILEVVEYSDLTLEDMDVLDRSGGFPKAKKIQKYIESPEGQNQIKKSLKISEESIRKLSKARKIDLSTINEPLI